MADTRAADLVRRYYEEALSHADWALLERLVSEDYLDHELVPGIATTRAGLTQKYELLRQGCPDLRFEIDDLMEAGDRVAARVAVYATHTAPFLGRPASGRKLAVSKFSIFRVAEGQLVEHWGLFDQMAMLAQFGLMPAAETREAH